MWRKIIAWLIRRKWFYRIVGFGAFTFLIFELNLPKLPQEAIPDYLKIEESYGPIAKTVLGYIVDRFAGGTNYWNVAITFILVVYCLYLEKQRFESKGKTFNFFGIFQNINQTINENEED
ncbi:hypothetical protein INR76_07860 [Marixanthomonas sp. SCSIO 43207]|uniref:hypothetical protein n=1 Tax=Marixanthomonas sp. SCSIO 43207 TaxID=2779360 RepID=UPI001CA8C441|nr:hypothetical protein [Marixanthomonas sp. SCSIO 43207]UAB80052.1 hypothetical protein INR76_07860 [Marixanthomonas sp. SCSIO 43207]